MARKGESPADSLPSEGSADADATRPIPFEQAVAELESIVQRMESGSLTLEESLAAYRRGAALVARCRSALADAQQQVRILEGELLKPFGVDEDAGEVAP
jgi:exodeoxyribonuclease VII small subunit